jgi:hypothetical protein
MKSRFDYDPETGVVTRLSNGKNNWAVSKGYFQVSIDGVMWYVHRLAWLLYYGEIPKGNIDHINGDRKDNRIKNLRIASIRDNASNAKRHRSGSLVGASFNKSKGRWQSQITVTGRIIHLGHFDTEIEAHRAYLEYKGKIGQ